MMHSFYYGLFVLRHCKTQNNIEHKISGQMDSEIVDFSIDVSNINQEFVYQLGLNIITSPAPRCLQTVELIKKQIPGRIKVETDYRLLERKMGDWEGEKKINVIANNSCKIINGHIDPNFTPPNGESILSCSQRVDDFISDLQNQKFSSPVLICSHNQTLKVLKSKLYRIQNFVDFWETETFKNGKIERLI